MHTLLGVDVFWKVQIQTDIDSDSTDGWIRYMYKAAKKNKVIQRYMEDLSLHTGSQTVRWEYKNSYI